MPRVTGIGKEFPYSRPYERAVDELVSLGYDELSGRNGARIITEHGDAGFLNRCPRCNHIPRRPERAYVSRAITTGTERRGALSTSRFREAS